MTGVGARSLEQEKLAFSVYFDDLHEEDYNIQERMDNLIAFKATNNPNTMCYHQAMRASDKEEFIKAMIKEVRDYVERKH